MAHKYNKGSEWRKWDLHIHTPESMTHNYKTGDGTDIWEQFILDIESLPEEIKVIGINDYIFIDGYKKILDYKSKGRMQNIELFLPVIELRIAKFGGNKQFKRINYHVIFSDKIKPDVIQSQFLNGLHTHYVLETGIEKSWWGGCIDHENLTDLGQKIIDSVPADQKTRYGSPLQEGFNNLNLSVDQINEVLQNYHGFTDKYITAIGKTEWDEFKWDSDSISEKKTIINDVKIVFTAAESVEMFHKSKDKLKSQGVNDLLLDCSDAHHNVDSEHKDRLGNCNTWIKADPTFEGLLQVLNEPSERIFIGDSPAIFDKIKYNKTKFIKKLTVKPIDGYTGQHGDWFDFELDLNPGLVVIIGNKGSGKSAIADMIALCSHINNQKDFSFLRVDKFRGKGKPASSFKSKLTFIDDTSVEKNLEDSSESNTNKLIKYLPQGYFETICNELSKAEQFQIEIENVVFQYIDVSDRLGKLDFRSLINAKTSSIDNDVESIKKEISILVEELVELEKKGNAKYKRSLVDKEIALNKEVAALDIPAVIEDPNKDEVFAQTNKAISESVKSITKEIEDIEAEIAQAQKDKASNNIEIQDLQNIKASIKQVIQNFEQIKEDNNIAKYDIDWDKLIHFEFHETLIEALIKSRQDKIDVIDILLGKTKSDSQKPITDELSKKQNELKQKQSELSGPQKQYQDYLLKLGAYNKRLGEIQGNASTASLDNIYGIKQEIEYVDNQLENEISNLFDRIIVKTENIHRLKRVVISIYEQVKQKIDEKINENKDILDGISIEINASLSKSSDFENKILQYIDKSVKGSFYGAVESQQRLSSITEAVEFNTANGTKLLIAEIRDCLKEDKRNGEKRHIDEQVRYLKSFYEYLFSIDYLESNYNLKQDGKVLEHLSPGEKGALLLVFYLLLDMDEKPLILDQPEDNLDNASVANTLVKFIKRAKNRRQIIIVTHNPNLAVVSDADQIVYVNINKKNKNKFSYESGSIENPGLNKRIVDVLEGAMPAFRKRDDKYYDVK